ERLIQLALRSDEVAGRGGETFLVSGDRLGDYAGVMDGLAGGLAEAVDFGRNIGEQSLELVNAAAHRVLDGDEIGAGDADRVLHRGAAVDEALAHVFHLGPKLPIGVDES